MGITLEKKANQLIPIGTLQALAKERPCVGIAYVNNGELGNTITNMDVKSLNDLQEAFKTFRMLFHFNDEGLPENTQQPYVILKGANNTDLALAVLSGKFQDDMRPAGSTNPVEFFIGADYLRSKCGEIYDRFNKDFSHFKDALTATITQRELRNCIGDFGMINILLADGTLIDIMKGTATSTPKLDMPWGWMSAGQNINVEPPKPAETPVVTPPKLSASDMLRQQLAAPPPAAPVEEVVEEEEEVPEAPVVQPPKTDTSVVALNTGAATDELSQELFEAPWNLNSRNEVKKWYYDTVGYCPPNPMSHPKVRRRVGFIPPKITRHMAVEEQPDAVVSKETQGTRVQETSNEKKKDVSSHIIKAEDTLPASPTIPQSVALDFIENFITKVDHGKSSLVPDPKTILSMESKIGSFADHMGLRGLEETFHWSYDDLLLMATGYTTVDPKTKKTTQHGPWPQAIALYAFDNRYNYAKLLSERPKAVVDTGKPKSAQDALKEALGKAKTAGSAVM